ncbi:hypothetical protein PMAYCL1PPCAC_32597, partial [Pristionchus mayeri]
AGLEEIAELLSHFEPDCLPPLTAAEREGTEQRPPVDWSPSSACVMCEVGQSTPTERVEPATSSKRPSSSSSSSTSSKPNGTSHPVNGDMMHAMLNYDLMMQANMFNMMAGQLNGMAAAGLMQPDFAALLNMAALMSKHQQQAAAHKGPLPPMLPFPHPHMFHPQMLMPPPPGRPKVAAAAAAEKPALDLSRKSGLQTAVAVDKRSAKALKRRAEASSAAEPEEPKPACGPGMKRNYTQADLDKAVTDIRCGRLGTRRASVVYGIPRSTLRNKIYKLEAADEQAGIAPLYKRRKAGGQSSAEKMLADVVEMTARSTLRKADESATSTPVDSPCKSVSPVEQAIDVKESAKEENAEEAEETEDDETDLVQASLRTLAEMAGSVAPVHEAAPETKVAADAVEPPHEAGDGGLDIFSQVLRNCLGPGGLPFDFLANNLLMHSPVEPVDKLVINGNSTIVEDQNAAVSPPIGSDWKKQRPKRGQYRKYDKEALDEAVQSVRRGEMSVHRAGSYYGVPHSTLEYKVKERNLAKAKSPKARDGSQNPSENPSEECDSSPSPSQESQPNNNEPLSAQFTAVV